MAEITGHIGRRLREIRTWRDLSQKELADHAGISRSYLSMIEAGQRPVERRATIEALASARVPDEIKARIAQAVQRSGSSTLSTAFEKHFR